jgi:hypothetical protein
MGAGPGMPTESMLDNPDDMVQYWDNVLSCTNRAW